MNRWRTESVRTKPTVVSNEKRMESRTNSHTRAITVATSQTSSNPRISLTAPMMRRRLMRAYQGMKQKREMNSFFHTGPISFSVLLKLPSRS